MAIVYDSLLSGQGQYPPDVNVGMSLAKRGHCPQY